MTKYHLFALPEQQADTAASSDDEEEVGIVIPGLELLADLKDAVRNAITTLQPGDVDTQQTQTWNNKSARVLNLTMGGWLGTAGHLSAMITREDERGASWFPCYLLVGAEQCRVLVDDTAKVVFTRSGNDYDSIAAFFGGIVQPGQDHQVAQGLLRMLVGQALTAGQPWQHQFLAELLTLMFGVEASRNNLTFATGVMLLDLIANQARYGRRLDKPFTLQKAFTSPYTWDHKTEGWRYGGKFPMTPKTGPGSLRRRNDMLAQVRPDQGAVGTLTDSLEQDRRFHGITIREITLTIHWLEMTLALGTRRFRDVDQLRQAVRVAFDKRLTEVYQRRSPPVPFQGGPLATGMERHYDFHYQEGIFHWHADGSLYHRFPNCKLFPGASRTGDRTAGSELEALNDRKTPCAHCYPRGQQRVLSLVIQLRCGCKAHTARLEFYGYPDQVMSFASAHKAMNGACNWAFVFDGVSFD